MSSQVRPGVQDIIVYGLFKEMDQNSIRVGGGRGKATILEVSNHPYLSLSILNSILYAFSYPNPREGELVEEVPSS